MLLTAKFEKIEPFSNIIFEEVFFANLLLSADINAEAEIDIEANVIKTVTPDEVDASESMSLSANIVKNTEEIQVNAESDVDAIASSRLFALVEIDAESDVDIVGSYISGALVEIDASSDIMLIANRQRNISVDADFSEIVYIRANSIIPIEEMSIDASVSTVIDVNKITNLNDVLIGSNIRIDASNIILRDMSGDYRESINTRISCGKILNAFINFDSLVSTDILCNIIANCENMDIDAVADVSIDASII